MASPAVHSGRVRIRQRKRRGRTLLRIIFAAALGWGLFAAYQIYRDNTVSDQRAIANCIEEHNQNAVGFSGEEAAAIAALCSRIKAAGQ
jgi:hypothetical protein